MFLLLGVVAFLLGYAQAFEWLDCGKFFHNVFAIISLNIIFVLNFLFYKVAKTQSFAGITPP